LEDSNVSSNTGQTILKTSLEILRLIVGYAASPGGLSLATAVLGATNPAILLVEQFGVRLLGPLLDTWTADIVTDADVTAALQAKGFKVTPYDPMAAFRPTMATPPGFTVVKV
jgi:hypothetical protein